MSKPKEHKIVVTRDRSCVRDMIDFWSLPTNVSYFEGVWSGTKGHTVDLYENSCAKATIKAVLGFLPRKGTKEVITITREKK